MLELLNRNLRYCTQGVYINMDSVMNKEIYLRPAWRSQWVTMLLIFLSVLAYLVFINPWAQLLLPVFIVYLILKMLIIRFSTLYMIGPKGVEQHIGILSQDMTRYEYRHIGGAYLRRSIMNRLMGLGHITVATSGTDADLRIKDIKNPQYYVDLIINRLKEL